MNRTRRTAIAGVHLALLLAAAACGGSAPAPSPTTSTTPTTTTPTTTTTSTTTTTTTTTTAPPAALEPAAAALPYWPPYTPGPGVDGIAPLTGLAADPASGAQPVLAVKVDNAPKARGQWNLHWADAVFEENVEGVTRFIALFQSRQPGEIGPIRSARTSDLDVLAGMNRPILAWSGGNEGVTAWVAAAHHAGAVVDASAFKVGRCYRRSDQRPKPHNLLVDPACIRAARTTGGPARPLWTFSAPGTAVAGEPVGAFTVTMDGVDVTWTWDPASGRYVRSQNGAAHVAADGTPITVTNVVVAAVGHVPSRVDARSPEAQTVGSGPVIVHRGGVAVRGRWVRDANTDPWTFLADDGSAIALSPGTTWFHLARSL